MNSGAPMVMVGSQLFPSDISIDFAIQKAGSIGFEYTTITPRLFHAVNPAVKYFGLDLAWVALELLIGQQAHEFGDILCVRLRIVAVGQGRLVCVTTRSD